jgi:acyl dehydratase
MNAQKSFFEDFKLGDKAVSPARTITETDIVMFAALSGDWSELHTNAEYMKNTVFGKRIAHGLLTLSIATGLALRAGARGTIDMLAFLGMDEVKFTNSPVFIGDTIHVEVEVVEARKSQSKPEAGILKFRNTVKNQRDEEVATYEAAVMVNKKPTK